MNFLEYLWGLVHRPFRLAATAATNSFYKLLQVAGARADAVADDIYWIRLQFHLHDCSWWALGKHGAVLDFTRLDNEDWEAYRARLLRAYEIFRMGGTLPGMKLAIESLGFPTVRIVEHYKTIGRSQWAVFSVVIPLTDAGKSSLDYRALDRLVWKLKPAHTLGKIRRSCFRTDNPNSLTDRDWLCI